MYRNMQAFKHFGHSTTMSYRKCGGTNELENLVVTCAGCNLGKCHTD